MEKHISILHSPDTAEPPIEPYVTKLRECMDISLGYPRGPTQVLDFLYLGRKEDAMNITLLARIGITHVVNCVSSRCVTGTTFYGSAVRRYFEFNAQDDYQYDIMQHFNEVYEVIENARLSSGRVLIHCEMGVNRSGVLTAAYVMVHKNWGPITAAVFVKSRRKWFLINEFFQLQLILFAQRKNMLQQDFHYVEQLSKV